jgi:hypothetical protein
MRNAVRMAAKRRTKKANIAMPTREAVSHLPESGMDVDVDVDVGNAWEAVVCVTVGVGAMASICVCVVWFGKGEGREDGGNICCL